MIRTFVSILAIVSSGFAFPAESLVNPTWEVTLAEFGEVNRPGMAVIVQKIGYFTQSTGKKDCPGKNLFSFPIDAGRRPASSLAEIDCVQNLQTDGKHLFVTYQSTQGSVTALWNGKSLAAFPKAALTADQTKKHEARLAWVRDYTGAPLPESEPLLFQGTRTGVMRRAQTGLWFDLFPIEEGNPLIIAPVYWKDADEPTAGLTVFGSEEGASLFALQQFDEWAKVTELRTTQPGIGPRSITFDKPSSDGDEWRIGEWSIMRAQFFGGVPGGAFLYEGSRHPQTVRGIYLVQSAQDKVNRVNVPNGKDLAGVSFARGGFVVSRPGQGLIQWYGTVREAFAVGTEVTVADIRRNPALADAANPDLESSKE